MAWPGDRPSNMDNLKYARPSDIITGRAVITTTGTVSTDINYGLSSLYNQNPAKPAKFQDLGNFYINWDFLTPVRLDAFALPNHNLDAGAPCRVQLSNDNFATTSVDAPLVPGPTHLDGHRASPWVDLTKHAGYTAFGYQYLRLYVPTNSLAVKIGEALVMTQLRSFSRWVMWGGDKGAQRKYLEALETEYGVMRVMRRRIKQRFFQFQLKLDNLDRTDWQDVKDLADDAGGLALPWFCVADGGKEDDDGLYVRFTRETAARIAANEEWYNSDNFTLSVLELSRGLPFTNALVETRCS